MNTCTLHPNKSLKTTCSLFQRSSPFYVITVTHSNILYLKQSLMGPEGVEPPYFLGSRSFYYVSSIITCMSRSIKFFQAYLSSNYQAFNIFETNHQFTSGYHLPTVATSPYFGRVLQESNLPLANTLDIRFIFC